MSKESSDALRIPIEIKTEDIQELQGLLQEINEAESTVRELKPLRGKSKSGISRSAIGGGNNDSFGIFAANMSQEAVPAKTRDKTSRQAFQRENQFEKLQEQVGNLQNSQIGLDSTLNSLMNGVFGISIGGQGLTTSQKIKSGIGGTAKISSVLSGGNLLVGLAAKLALPIGAALIAVGFVENVIKELTRPGGVFDTRFKRDYAKESTRLSSLQEKAEISAGRRVLRVSTTASLRGESSQVRSNYDIIKKGVRIYDLNGQMAKGIGLGTI